MRIIVLFVCLLAAGPARAATAEFTRTPAGDVMVGEEVFFDASASTGGTDLLSNGTFEWDFGDGYVQKIGQPYYYSANGGVTLTHFFMNTGTFTVSLVVTDGDGDIDTVTSQVTVTGTDPKLPPRPAAGPLVELKFENDLTDGSGNGYDGAWSSGAGTYVDGREGRAVAISDAYVAITDNGALDGLDAVTVSVLAQKSTTASNGYLFDKNDGDLSLYVDGGDGSLSGYRRVTARIRTSSGVGQVSSYLADDITNTNWHHYAVTYDGAAINVYIDNRLIASGSHSGTLSMPATTLLLGQRSGQTDFFEGNIDEFKVYGSALTQDELYIGFELWHADFHGRVAQYLYAQVPGEVTRNAANRIKAVLSDDGGNGTVLLEKNGPAAEERILLRNGELAAGEYTLTVQLLDEGDNVLDEIVETFSKPYAGVPAVGINEHNAICMDGEPFFPITPWGLATSKYATWKDASYINTLCGTGWGTENLTSWSSTYLTAAADAGLPFIGPAMWPGLPGTLAGGEEKRNADIDLLEEYVTATKDNSSVMMWCWVDEPDLGGSAHTTCPVVRSWNYKCHELDPQHLMYTNLVGYGFGDLVSDYSRNQKKEYCYLYSGPEFGGKRALMCDVYGFDYYPYDNLDDGYTMTDMALSIDRIHEWNHNLIPFMPWIETCNIFDDEDAGPTAAQLKHIIWLNVVHGVKGISWFHYFQATPTENYAVMAEFTQQITSLTPVVLGPASDLEVGDNADDPGRRVDFMVRESADSVYIFAVRLTEPTESDSAAINVTFSAPRLTTGDITVYGESRTVSAGTGTFTDSFEPDAVHIYVFPHEMLDVSETRSAVRIPRFELRGVQPYRSLEDIRVSGDVERVSVYGGDGGLLGRAPVENGRAVWSGTLRSGVYYIGVDGAADTYRKIIIVRE